MIYKEIDLIFPFVVLAYGAVMTFVLNCVPLMRLAQEKLPTQVWHQLQAHRTLGLICLVVGSLWSLQNIWIY